MLICDPTLTFGMKKSNTFAIHKLVIFLTIALLSSIKSFTAPFLYSEPPPPGLVEPTAVPIDSYLVPMIIIGVLFAVYIFKKNHGN